MSNRPNVHTITLGFAPSRIWRRSLEQYRATRNPDLAFDHYFVDQHYPVDKERNRVENRAACEAFGVKVLDPGRNLGLHAGFNWALDQINPAPGDIIIAYDSDMFPTTPGWDMALVRSIWGDPKGKAVWASLMHDHVTSPDDLDVAETRLADGFIKIHAIRRAIMNSTCAFSYDWLRRVGGLTEPCAFYGHLESAMFSRLGEGQWVFVEGWSDSALLRNEHDEAYTQYKWVHAHLRGFAGDFESWLAAGKPGLK